MHPVLFSIGGIRIESYYVFWGLAIYIMLIWTRKRAVSLYSLGYNQTTDVLRWVLSGALLGAMIGGYFDNWERYAQDPLLLLKFWQSGLSSGPGFLGGGLFGLYKLRKESVPVWAFAEASSIPAAFMVGFGRIGCFLAGCCYGVPTSSLVGVRFPALPDGMYVFPTQLFESIAAFLFFIVLSVIEKNRKPSSGYALLAPLFMIFYGSYRILVDFLRAGDRIAGLRVGQYMGIVSLAVGILWLVYNHCGRAAVKKINSI